MSVSTVASKLPYYASTLVGRDQEIKRLETLIDDPEARLVTITGTSGVGKTRLVTHVAWQHLQSNDTDVLFVPLATITNPDLVLAEIGKEMGLHGTDLTTALRRRLDSWRGLVILDNFEQIIEASSTVRDIFPQNPEVTFLVTSQRMLHVDGERVVRIGPLETPDRGESNEQLRTVPSVQLMLDRAQSLDDSMEKNLANDSAYPAIAEICRMLEGIPLALELAASRLPGLTPEVVLAQLEKGQHILSSQRRDSPDRHRTMESAFQWSADLLPDTTRRTFIWLGAFTAGFDMEIVEFVTARLNNPIAAMDTVDDLVQLSLVRRVRGGEHPWYMMLAPIREFCISEMMHTDEWEQAQALVTDYVVDLTGRAEHGLKGSESTEWREHLDTALPTIRSAISWSLDSEKPDVPFMVAHRIWRFLEQSGSWREGVDWISHAEPFSDGLEAEQFTAGLLAKLELQSAGRDLAGASNTESQLRAYSRSNVFPHLQADFLLASGRLALRKHQLDDAEKTFAAALEINQHLGNEHNIARANGSLGHLAYLRGDFAKAEMLLLQSAETMRRFNDYSGAASVLQNLANVSNLQLNTEMALTYIDEAIEISRAHNLTLDLIYALFSRVVSLGDLQRIDEALATTTEALELTRSNHYPALTAQALYMLGAISYLKEDYQALGGYFLTALDETHVSDMPQVYTEIGNFLASALAKSGRYREAIAIQGGYDSFAKSIDYTVRDEAATMREETLALSYANAENSEAVYADGTSWSTYKWVGRLKQSARRLSLKPSLLLVQVPGSDPEPQSALTARENEVVQLLANGLSTNQMSETLSLSPRTVTTHIGNAMAKLGVSSRAELVAWKLRSGS